MTSKKILKTMISVAIISTLSACGGGDPSEPQNTNVTPPLNVTDPVVPIVPVDNEAVAHKINLANVAAIFMTGNSRSQTTSVIQKTAQSIYSQSSKAKVLKSAQSIDIFEANTAYKILKDGTIEKLNIEDRNGDDLERGSAKIVYIDEITNNYKVIYILNQASGEAIPYLLNNLSGRLFSLDEALIKQNVAEVWSYTDLLYRWEYNDIDALEAKDGSLFLRDDDSVLIIDKPIEAEAFIASKRIVDITGSWTTTQDNQYIIFSQQLSNGAPNGDVFAINVDTQARYDMNALIADKLGTARVKLDKDIIHSFNGKTYLYHGLSSFCDAYEVFTGDDGLPDIKESISFVNTVDPWIYENSPEEIITTPTDHGGTLCINDLPLKQINIDGKTYYRDSSYNLLSIDWNKQTFSNITKYFSTYEGLNGKYNISPELVNEKILRLRQPDSIKVSEQYIYRTGKFAENSDNYEIFEDAYNGNSLLASVKFYESNDIAIERFDVNTGESIVYFSKDSDYVLSSIDLASDGTLYVQGQQLTTGATFFGTLEDGNVNVTSTSGSYAMPEIIKLLMISTTDLISVDGNSNDWNIDYRILSDATSDQVTGDIDLTFYSEDRGNGYYYGLVEHSGNLTANTRVTMQLSNGNTLIAENDSLTLLNNELEQISSSELVFAQGIAFEFKIDLDTIGSSTSVDSVSVQDINDVFTDSME